MCAMESPARQIALMLLARAAPYVPRRAWRLFVCARGFIGAYGHGLESGESQRLYCNAQLLRLLVAASEIT